MIGIARYLLQHPVEFLAILNIETHMAVSRSADLVLDKRRTEVLVECFLPSSAAHHDVLVVMAESSQQALPVEKFPAEFSRPWSRK